MRSVVLKLDSNDEFVVRHFSILEAMSAAFQVHVIASARDDMEVHQTGKPASFFLATDRGTRWWTGVAASITLDSVASNGTATYSILVAPELILLSHRTNHRIFQHLSVPEIAKALLAEWSIHPEMKIKGTHPKLELRVQYGETDYDFLRRLLAEAGISFYFESTKEGSKLVLSDEPHKNEARPPVHFLHDSGMMPDSDHVSNVSVHSKVHATRATLADHDFRRPSYHLSGEHSHPNHVLAKLEHYLFSFGHTAAADPSKPSGTPVADAHGVYRHQDHVATARAAQHVDALAAAAGKIAFQTSLDDLIPGAVFSIDGHPHPELSLAKKLLVTESWVNGEVNGRWTCGGHAVRADRPYRPLVSRTLGDPSSCSDGGDPFKAVTSIQKPRIPGVQSALVVGPAGQTIHTDEHGRVRVHFPWDRESHPGGMSSAWLRVSQASTGAGFGHIELPRVGQEVLVAFLHGDPDHPVVVGRLHNATTPEPYALPEHKTRSTWKSGTASGGGNEVTFDDKSGSELMYLQAERDLHKVVKQNELEHTVGDRHITVDGDFIIHAKGKIVLQGGAVHVDPLHKTKDATEAKVPPQLSTGKPSASGSSNFAKMNQSIFKMNPGHRPDSIANAKARLALAEKYKPLAEKLAVKYNLPPALILAWMSRESGLGTLLRPDGYSKFDGFGYGLLQVDRRYHTPTGDPFGEPSCDQAIGDVFDGMMKGVKAQHPDWTPEQQLAGALVDYNSGSRSAQTQPSTAASWAAMDRGTAGNDYSQDVFAQGQYYAENLKW